MVTNGFLRDDAGVFRTGREGRDAYGPNNFLERLSSELGCRATWDNFAVRLNEGLLAEALVAGVQAVRAADEDLLPAASE